MNNNQQMLLNEVYMYHESQEFNNILNFINEKTALESCKKYSHHGHTNLYEHSVAVAYLSYKILKRVNDKNLDEVIIGALLHDYFLYDWHIPDDNRKLHGINHPITALENAKKELALSDISQDVIKKHMFPLTLTPPKYFGSWVVSLSDKIIATQEIYDNFSFKIKHYMKERSFI